MEEMLTSARTKLGKERLDFAEAMREKEGTIQAAMKL